ncbi:C-X-C motif chemokine 6-like [Pteronotus mesoamericanus]|uniref:C-X-C motif chemokine 6-like n=1 Tax=Pteronotus mesoamericanus TaxID=1884717 RepID=UPI0023EC797B|nr:C-X-C motif chemokine 6-like [Pteronotus parnellii mesoamericanus]
MSLLPSCAARVPGSSGSLCVLLALLLLTPPRPLASAAPSSVLMTELRCVCLSITTTVHPKMISNLEVIAAGPQCPKVELIATLKNGKEICLDPEAPLVKKIFHKILSRSKTRSIMLNSVPRTVPTQLIMLQIEKFTRQDEHLGISVCPPDRIMEEDKGSAHHSDFG